MNRLDMQLQRLGFDQVNRGRSSNGLVLELHKPAKPAYLLEVWRAVQRDLGLPPPALAISGMDAYQVWFATSAQLKPAQAFDFLSGLCNRYLSELPGESMRIWPQPAADASGQASADAMEVPPKKLADGRWSAFVLPSLIEMFEDEPWLEIEPGVDAQADLLARVEPFGIDEFNAALQLLSPEKIQVPATMPVRQAAAEAAASAARAREFLLSVMDDQSLAIDLRVQAAVALLAASNAS
jgi:hypothetical protein